MFSEEEGAEEQTKNSLFLILIYSNLNEEYEERILKRKG